MRFRQNWKISLLALLFVWAMPIIAFMLPENAITESQLNYTLTWDLTEIETTDTGWQTTNNLGYTITVTSGYSVAYETQLTACDHSHGWFDWLQEPTVYAGHGDDSNVSTISASQVESLTSLEVTQWGTVTLNEPTYCEAFFLVARADDTSSNLPTNAELIGTSLTISGTYQASESDEVIDFMLSTHHANGTITDFIHNDQSVHLALSVDPIEIEITRSLSPLFDDIDFANDTVEDASFQALRNLLNHTQMTVIAGDTHPN